MSKQEISVEAASGGCSSPLTREPLTADEAAAPAAVFKALGDPVRLRLLSLVAGHADGEACVCDVSAAFELSQPTISHHLKVLRAAGLVECERRGTWVYYRVVPATVDRVADLLAGFAPSPLATPTAAAPIPAGVTA